MRSKSIAAAIAVAACLAVPTAVQAHPFTTDSGVFSGEMPQIGLDSGFVAAGPSGYRGQSAVGDYDTKRLQFLSLSRRDAPTLGQANSDIAFQGNRAYQGNFQGFRIIDISAPGNLRQILAYEDCAGQPGRRGRLRQHPHPLLGRAGRREPDLRRRAGARPAGRACTSSTSTTR